MDAQLMDSALRDNENENRRKKRIGTIASLLVTIVLMLMKLGAGLATGSLGALSEALHSATDVVAALITFFSVRAADIPPDYEHPYGHGNIESLASLTESILIFAGAGIIVRDAITRLHTPIPAVQIGAPIVLIVMAVSSIASMITGILIGSLARSVDSPALTGDGVHLRSDALSSSMVFAGLLIARLTGWSWVDPVIGILVALWIVRMALILILSAIPVLMDMRLPEREEALIRQTLDEEPQVLGYHKLRTRKSGSRRDADVHVQFDDDSSLVDAHDLAEELEDRIRSALPFIHINIHIEPYRAELRHQQHSLSLKNDSVVPYKENERISNGKKISP